jgi:hypothetical protein
MYYICIVIEGIEVAGDKKAFFKIFHMASNR